MYIIAWMAMHRVEPNPVGRLSSTDGMLLEKEAILSKTECLYYLKRLGPEDQ